MKVLVIGCGSIGYRHLKNVLALKKVSASACELDKTIVARISEEFAIPIFSDVDQALALMPDLAIIAVPNYLHIPLALKALKSNSHVFIEKPLSHSLDGFQDLKKLAERKNKKVFVGCNMRFHEPIEKIDEWLSEGRIGNLIHVKLSYGNYLPRSRDTDYKKSYVLRPEQGGGILFDSVHELDLIRRWMHNPKLKLAHVQKSGTLDKDLDDSVDMVLETAAKQVAVLHSDYYRRERSRFYELIGTHGVIRWDALGKNPENSTLTLTDSRGEPKLELNYSLDLNEMYKKEIRKFFQCIHDDETPPLSIVEAAELLRILLAANSERHPC